MKCEKTEHTDNNIIGDDAWDSDKFDLTLIMIIVEWTE